MVLQVLLAAAISASQIATLSLTPQGSLAQGSPTRCPALVEKPSAATLAQRRLLSLVEPRRAIPEIGILSVQQLRKGNWLLAFRSSQPISLSGAVEVSTERATYVFNLPATPINTPLEGSIKSFRSAPVVFTVPTNEPLDTVRIREPAEPGLTCALVPLAVRLPQADGSLTQAPPPTSFDGEILREAPRKAPALHSRFVRNEEPMTCAEPFRAAKVAHTEEADYPEEARKMLARGLVAVLVRLDAAGGVTQAAIQESAGNLELDREALRAARTSTYAPEISRCRGVPSHYMFRVDFSGQ